MSRSLDALLKPLFSPQQQAPIDSLDAWRVAHRAATQGLASPIDRAIAGAILADRVAYAFASGISSALQSLVPDTGDRLAALCVTERAGNHPRALTTSLTELEGKLTLDGEKTFVTFGTEAEILYVAARAGDHADGKPRIVLVAVPRDARGVTTFPAKLAPIVPEVPHAVVRLDQVIVDGHVTRVLEGDGYDRYVKRFRTVEDLHVFAAIATYATRACIRAQNSERFVGATRRNRAGGATDETRCWTSP
jgi:alkylation response protein AidB-like acyl-CoA dehydrogenase